MNNLNSKNGLYEYGQNWIENEKKKEFGPWTRNIIQDSDKIWCLQLEFEKLRFIQGHATIVTCQPSSQGVTNIINTILLKYS